MTRYKLTALLMALILAFSLLIAPAAYADKTVNLTDLINSADTATEGDAPETTSDNSENTAEKYDPKIYADGKEFLQKVESDFEQPNPEDYIKIESQGENYFDYSGRAVFYACDNSVSGYKAPDGKDKIIDLPLSEPVVPVAERDDYYCVYVIYNESACWVKKDAISDNFYHQNDPVVESLRDEISSWTDIKEICTTDGSIIGLKNDGTTVSARYKPYGVDVSNWGKLKSLGICEVNYSDCIYGASKDSKNALQTMLYSTEASSYKYSDSGYIDGYSSDKNELRYYTGGLKKPTEEGSAFLMEDGTVHGHIVDTYLYDGLYVEWNYAFTQNGNWNYVMTWTGKGEHKLFTEKNGQIDWDNYKIITKDDKYSPQNIAVNIMDIYGNDGEGDFTAITKNGDILIYGHKVGLAEHADSEDSSYIFNYDFTGLDKLVSENIAIRDGKLITMIKCKEAGANYYENDLFLHPEVYESWDNIEYAYLDDYALIAIDRTGKVYVDVAENIRAECDCGQYDGAKDWSEKVVYIQGDTDFENHSYSYLLGVTEDGNVLISGILPDEAA